MDSWALGPWVMEDLGVYLQHVLLEQRQRHHPEIEEGSLALPLILSGRTMTSCIVIFLSAIRLRSTNVEVTTEKASGSPGSQGHRLVTHLFVVTFY